jgi:hypothetical protein
MNQLMKAIVLRILRPDRLVHASQSLTAMVLGEGVVN